MILINFLIKKDFDIGKNSILSKDDFICVEIDSFRNTNCL